MPDVQNLNFSLAFADVIVDQKRTVHQFSDLSPLSDQPADARETSQEFHMLDQGTAKVKGGIWIVFGNVADDFCEIV